MPEQQIAWKRLFAEGAAILISILLAFAIDAWWEERKEQREARQSLSALRDEFLAHREQLAGAISGVDARVETIATLLTTSPADIAVSIFLSGPQLPCMTVIGRPLYGSPLAITPQAAMTRL